MWEEEEGTLPNKKQAPPLLLALLQALERLVSDTDSPVFIRGYAWYRLLRHWASLRFGDTAGLPPSTLLAKARRFPPRAAVGGWGRCDRAAWLLESTQKSKRNDSDQNPLPTHPTPHPSQGF